MVSKSKRTHSVKQYIGKLNRVADLQKSAQASRSELRRNIWERASLLSEVFQDVEWREKVAGELNIAVVDDISLSNVLDRYVDDAHFSFCELRQILHHFPDGNQWEKGDLLKMWDDARTRQAKPNGRQSTQTKKRPTAGDLERAEQRNRVLEAKLKEAVSRASERRTSADVAQQVASTPHERTLEGIARTRAIAQQYIDAHDVFGQVLQLLDFAEAEFSEEAKACSA